MSCSSKKHIQNLFQNGEMLDYGDGSDDSSKNNMKKTGDKYLFSINNLGLNDGGLYQVDVDDVNIITTKLEGKHYIF